jgi:diguanylate cyclase (GGDEF)-like protein
MTSTRNGILPDRLPTEPASPRQRRILLVAAVLTALLGAAALVDASHPLPAVPVLPLLLAPLVFASDVLTGSLLRTRFRLSGRSSQAFLASAYSFAGLIGLALLLTFPNGVGLDQFIGARPDSSLWLWVFWQTGFPCLILTFAAVRRVEGERRLTAAQVARWAMVDRVVTALVVVGLVVLVTLGRDLLPVLLRGDGYAPLSNSFLAAALIVLNLAALLALLDRMRTAIEMGLALSQGANTLTAILLIAGGARYTVGWSAAWFSATLSATSALVAFLSEMAWLYLRLIDHADNLRRLAFIDPLTGLPNRRQFTQRLEAEWARAVRERRPIGLIMVDVDHFKKFNDRFGHPAGDACLCQIAQTIGQTIRRPTDLAARFGGEEFAVILPDTDGSGALHVAGAIADNVRRIALNHDGGTAGIVTVSQGLAVRCPGLTDSAEDLLYAADQALYAAKSAGRDRIVADPGGSATQPPTAAQGQQG